MRKVHNLEPMICGYIGCTFQCFELMTMVGHAKEHYPEAVKNDLDYQTRKAVEGLRNVSSCGYSISEVDTPKP